ncbi:MAG: hypothetical protein ABI690_09810 [Chloroflexota bacterium]
MSNDGSKRSLIIISVLMIVAIAGSSILSLFTNGNSAVQTTDVPTEAPLPTFPPPITDFSTVKFDQDYLHPSGLFSVAQPTGWTPASPVSNPNGAEITMNNANVLSVIQVSLQIANEPIDSLDKLDALYTSATLNDSWSNYRRDSLTGLNYRETGRKRDNNQLALDFELKNNRLQTFLARQIAWADGTWVYSVRVVMPENAIDTLKFMVDSLVPTLHGYKAQFEGTPADWKAYFDPTSNFVIRYPSTWTLDDGGPGRPTSFSGDNAVLRVEAQAGTQIADEAAARAWVEASRAGATVVSVKPVTRGEQTGFSVAYSFTDADGNPQSGLALLLNTADALHIANLRITAPDIDLNGDGLAEPYATLAKILSTFQSLGSINVPLPTPTPTPTLAPPTATSELPTATETLAPTATATDNAVEVTLEIPTETVTAETTVEATVPPTATKIPATATTVPPTATKIPATATTVPPTATKVPPTATSTPTPTGEATAESTP